MKCELCELDRFWGNKQDGKEMKKTLAAQGFRVDGT